MSMSIGGATDSSCGDGLGGYIAPVMSCPVWLHGVVCGVPSLGVVWWPVWYACIAAFDWWAVVFGSYCRA